MRLVAISVLSVAITGCAANAISQQAALAQQTHAAAIDHCKKRFPDRHAKPTMPRIVCLNDANLRYGEATSGPGGIPILDLIQVGNAQMVVAAERYDSGRISVGEFDLQTAQVMSAYQSAASARIQNQQMVAAAQTQANAAVYQSIAAQQQATAAQNQAQQQSMPTTCIQTGTIITCN